MGASPKALSSKQPHRRFCQCLTWNGWGGKGSMCPSALMQGHPEQVAQHHVQVASEDLQRGDSNLWSTCAPLHHPHGTVALPDGQSTHPDSLTRPLSPWIPPADLQPRALPHALLQAAQEGRRWDGRCHPPSALPWEGNARITGGGGGGGEKEEARATQRQKAGNWETSSQRHNYA